jgi:hypothetical protein
MDIIYAPKEKVAYDQLLGEDPQRAFSSAFTIEMYIDSASGFGGIKNFIDKYGWNIDKEIKLSVSRSRWTQVVGTLRPMEGDIILFPLANLVFEISVVDHEDPFYQTGKSFVWKITAHQWKYSHEILDTGIPNIDNIATDFLNDDSVVNDPLADNIVIDTSTATFLDTSKKNPLTQ